MSYNKNWMRIISVLLFAFFSTSIANEKIRELEHNGSMVSTTYSIEDKFLGKYMGSKGGFLHLDGEGSGVYRYDYPGLSPDCHSDTIKIKWGFIVDEHGDVVKLERSYGLSYPIIYNCSGQNAFQGCTKRSMLDFLLVYNDGTITVSSSDDWTKTEK